MKKMGCPAHFFISTSRIIPVATSGNDSVVAATLTTFRSSDGAPDKIYSLKLTSPIAYGSFTQSTITSGSLVKDSRYEERVSFNSYDSYKNILEQRKTNDLKNSYVWDYSSKYPIAEVTNASKDTVAYTSFESDGSGGWSGITSSNAIANANALTGRKYLSQTSFSISKSGLSSSSSYIVSYWSRNGAYSVNSSSSTTGRTYNGWTYYEHLVSNPSGGTITVSGSGAIDELRLYPSKALMSTRSYDPLVGITSECDANNRITYYEYDGLGRLYLIKDQNGNVVKKICYNYSGQAGSCTLFGNTQQSLSFNRNNCSTGYVGGTVTYTVSANTYYASSQDQANALALVEINANGQAYANANGTCTLPTTIYAIIQADYAGGYDDGCNYEDDYDIYIRFFSDAGCTTPISVSGLNVNYSNWTSSSGYSYYTQTGCSGTQVYLGNYNLNSGNVCLGTGYFSQSFATTAGTGYTHL